MKSNKIIHMVTFILVIVGGINWLILGVSGWEIGELFGGQNAMISRVLYILVGLSAIYLFATHKSDCKTCAGMGKPKSATPSQPGATPMT